MAAKERVVDTKTLYNKIKQLAPETILDMGNIIVPVTSGKLRMMDTDTVKFIDGEIYIFRMVNNVKKSWEVRVGKHGPIEQCSRSAPVSVDERVVVGEPEMQDDRLHYRMKKYARLLIV